MRIEDQSLLSQHVAKKVVEVAERNDFKHSDVRNGAIDKCQRMRFARLSSFSCAIEGYRLHRQGRRNVLSCVAEHPTTNNYGPGTSMQYGSTYAISPLLPW